jgi:putative permease
MTAGSTLNKGIFWSILVIIALLFSYLAAKTLTPFLIAFILAYMLQPAIARIKTKFKIPYSAASYCIYSLFFGSFVIGIIILLPIIYQQIFIFINKIPVYKDYIQTSLIPVLTEQIVSIDPFIADKIKNAVESLISSIFGVIATIFNNIWVYTMATINMFIIAILVPVILLYFLRDWPKIIKTFEGLMPLVEKSKIRKILSSINNLISAYIRGQLNVCLILSVYYSIGLYLLGLEPALLLGIASGFLIIIPFIGSLLSFITVMIIGYFTFGFGGNFIYLIILYSVGMFAEGYILTPKIIGDRIGLHPLWIMFAVLSLGSLFGFVGIFFAIPIAGTIKILLKSLIDTYKTSRFYKS